MQRALCAVDILSVRTSICSKESAGIDKRVWLCDSDVDVAVPLIAHHNLLSSINVCFGFSAEKTNIDSHLDFLGGEREKYLLALHCLTGCNICQIWYSFQGVMKKLFVKIKDQDFLRYLKVCKRSSCQKLMTIYQGWSLEVY